MRDSKSVLVADDSADDILILKRAFARAGLDVQFDSVRGGEEVVSYLSGENQFSDRQSYPFPRLLLLDLKMPGMDGFHVLDWLRSQEVLKRMVVIVLTSSGEQRDVDRSFELGANSFLVKPSTMDGYAALAEKIHSYWFRTSESPNCESR